MTGTFQCFKRMREKSIASILGLLNATAICIAFLLFTFCQHANTWRVAHSENIYNKLIVLNIFWRNFDKVILLVYFVN